MTTLAPQLVNRRYDDLVQIGRSRLPGVAPEWTDHNAHDPGITLIELLAWVAEAQLYSLSRMRRDERSAYAALMGIIPSGGVPAQGLIWPDHDDPDGPPRILQRAQLIEPDAAIHIARTDTPMFVPARRLLWIPARVDSLKSWFADGTNVDHLMANRRGGPAFQPFGEGEGRGTVLRLVLAAKGWAPLFDPDRPRDAALAIGIRVDPGPTPATDMADRSASALDVQFVTDDGAFALPIIEDGTQALQRTGVLILDISAVPGAPQLATLEFRAPDGIDRAPRLLRIEPNVLPVVQRHAIEEPHDANGLPDQQFDLETPGIAFAPGAVPVTIEIERFGGLTPWTPCDRLADFGPDDRVFAFDPVAARVMFGNGINGAIPPAETTIVARYAVCNGKRGNLAANRKWVVRGFAGIFGINPDGFVGGADAAGSLVQRSAARTALRESHALVSAWDFEEAARALVGLEVGRAWMMPPTLGDLASGTMRLVAMQARSQGREPQSAPETERWLAAVQQALTGHMLLGARIEVVAPRYVSFAVRARIEPEPRTNPVSVLKKVLDELARRLTLVSSSPAVPERAFGQAVTQLDLAAWIQALPEVRRVTELFFLPGDGVTANKVTLSASGLPHLDSAGSDIQIVRPTTGGAL